MTSLENLKLDYLGSNFPSVDDRLGKAYLDPVIWDRSRIIMKAPPEERPSLQAELTTYLAAAYILFPEESEIAVSSLSRVREEQRRGEA